MTRAKWSGVSGINCIRNPRIKCHQKAISAQPECAEHPACLLGMECSQKGMANEERFKKMKKRRE